MKFIIYLFILFITFSSCKKKKSTIDIGSTVFIELRDSSNQNVQLRAATGEIYPCVNYPIIYSKRQLGTTITINFKAVEKSDICLTATGSASSNIDLGSLKKENYNLKFKLNGKTTKGTLTTNPYRLEIETGGNVLKK